MSWQLASRRHQLSNGLPPKADISAPVRQGGFRVHAPGRISPRIGQTNTLGDLIDRLLPALLSIFHGIPSFGYLRGDVLLDVMLGHRKLYGLTRAGQRL
jgi:hypothetical protein